MVFAINTTVSTATKCTPYFVVFGRKPTLPQDLVFNTNASQGTDIITTLDYATETKLRLTEVHKHVATNLGLNRIHMQQQYNKNINFHIYCKGDKVWLKRKYFKTGETQKLAPRRNGSWTILEKLKNGVNFRIQNDVNKKKQVVQNNRLYPAQIIDDHDNTQPGNKLQNAGDTGNQPLPIKVDDTLHETEFSSSDESDANPERPEEPQQIRRYPLRNRWQRTIEGSIPWDNIHVIKH